MDKKQSDVLLRFQPKGGDQITFSAGYGHLEMLRLCDNGDIYVRGRLVENDKEVVEAMREFLVESGHMRPREGHDGKSNPEDEPHDP